MQNTHVFDPLTVPIKGTNLIEASAGTGKTWSIAALFLRLILVEKIDVAQILVVTYTKAATAELKTRLRARLSDALEFLKYPESQLDDPFLVPLFDKINDPKHEQILRLQAALNHFDKATIYTIHGFCQRVLQEYAFLCGSPFEVELVSENDKVLLTLAEDFWRTEVIHNPLLAKLVFTEKLTPKSVLDEILPSLSKPYLIYKIPQSTLKNCEENLAEIWPKFSLEKTTQLNQIFWEIHPSLNGNKYRKTTYERLFNSLQVAIQEQDINKFLELDIQNLSKLQPSELIAATKKNADIPEEVLEKFYFLGDFISIIEDYIAAQKAEIDILKFKLYEYLNVSIQKHNQNHQQRRFDDLLLDLYQALQQSSRGSKLSYEVAQKWQIALIDEFQDTDPIQYQIFHDIFITHNRPLFLVGDPKQAIYKFRGADIFAYLEAARQAEHHYSLNTNYRTHQKLLTHFSSIFNRHSNPFLFEDIRYTEVAANRLDSKISPDSTSLTIQWLENPSIPEETLNKDMARDMAAQNCANQIASQLMSAQSGGIMYDSDPLQAKDIAVLVSTHNQGKLIRDKLKALNIDSVSLSQESVFASEEARTLLVLLNAWLKPNKTSNIIALMASPLFQYTAKELYELNQDDTQLLPLIQSMQNFQDLWQSKGILVAYQQFNLQYQISEKLLHRSYERSLTNITQLLELLAHEESKLFGLHAQLNAFTEQINLAQEGKKTDASQLRLENDENLVKIITIHSSKGLQYPVVYCPFIWDSFQFSLPKMAILNKNNQNFLYSEQQLSENDKKVLEHESLAEKLRLLYVAITRAQEQLILTVANASSIENTAIGYLFLSPEQTKDKKLIGMHFKQELRKFSDSSTDIIFNENMTPDEIFTEKKQDSLKFSARTFSGKIHGGKRTSSFSELSTFTKVLAEDEILPQRLDIAENIPQEEVEYNKKFNRFTLPKGNKTGLCLHSILEQLDFQESVTSQLELIEKNLEQYQIDPSLWLESVIDILEHTLTAKLNNQFSLLRCSPEKRLPEMGFTFNTHSFTLNKLHNLLALPQLNIPKEFISAAKQLDFPTLNGFCNGFIDLIALDSQNKIYVIDYKSNYLGSSFSHYQGHFLIEAIAEHHYYLQAILYSVASYRYFLQRKQPITGINIRYLFLRGLQEDKNTGVWEWDIDLTTLKLLDEMLS